MWLLVVLAGSATGGFAADPPLPQPVATLDLVAMLPSGPGEPGWATVAFASENSIAVGLCREDCTGNVCSLFLVRWEDGTLRLIAQTPRFDSGTLVHPASGGRILAGQSWGSSVLYSEDLAMASELPKHLSHLSTSGRAVAEWGRGSWKLYRLADSLEPIREGTGEVRSVSDDMVLIQDGKVIRIETLDGKRLGSFSVKDEAWGYHAALLGTGKLYLDDCTRVKVVDFDGKTQLEMHPRGGCDQGNNASADGRRMLFDFSSHKVSGLANVLESIRTITSFGMVGAEDVNREDVRVYDTVTGKTCFEWQRSFPATYSRVKSAAISPSGEFVAIAAAGTLSIYRLPADCGAASIRPAK